jgi:predicted transcriptional regulator
MDNQTLNLLKLFEERNSLSLVQLAAILNTDPISLSESVAYLKDLNYIKFQSNHKNNNDSLTLDAILTISYSGRIALKNDLTSKKHFKYTEFRAWFTFLIALAAFVKSFFY